MSDGLPRQVEASTTWHSLSLAEVRDALGCDTTHGLDSEAARLRLQRYGPNRLDEKPPRPRWLKFFDQFRNLLVLMLLAAAVVAGLLGDFKDAVVIGVVVLLNATLGLMQESRAEAALAALKNMLAPVARVRRNGELALIPAEQLVPGDLLLLEAGDRIAADARVVVARAAEVAEAALTGEASAVTKQSDATPENSALAGRRSMVYMNTVVTRGRIEALVCATGMRTEMGQLAGLMAVTADAPTPLQLQLDALGKRLALIAGLVVGLIFALGILRGDALLGTAMTAIALAVAAIPEGLPAVVTVTLALGMHRMAARHAVVKKLAAVETLGCTTVICSDKTGTLTLNQMSARRAWLLGRELNIEGDGYSAAGRLVAADGGDCAGLGLALRCAALCADARLDHGQLIGDPTEGALLALAAKAGIDADTENAARPRIAEIPFDSTHKFMATFHRDGDAVQIWLKGAPDRMLERATHWHTGNGEAPLDDAARAAFAAHTADYAADALRVLALAGRRLPFADFDATADLMPWAHDLTLLGLVGIIDPPRPEARAAIATCRTAGVEVKMITGDHRATAAAIARELGLDGEMHDGHTIDGLDQEALGALVERTAVFARVSPAHKLAIVKSLQARGHVVAMTGDGVNDAPALKAADIGVAMGVNGTEVSREAATLVLADDNFATIVRAIKEGRTIYDNIVTFVRFQLSTNIGALLTVLVAPVFGLPMPFTAIQILWVNIIMDGPPAMSLGVEPAQPGIMQQAPRAADAHILTARRLLGVASYGVIMATGTLLAYAWGAQHGATYAATLAFTTFVLFQFFNIFNARSEHRSAFNRQMFSNRALWAALTAVLLLQALVVHWAPAQAVFDTVDLRPADWLFACVMASSVLLLNEARKGFQAYKRLQSIARPAP